MSFSYILLAEATLEYETSLEWYLDRSIMAAENFVISFEKAVQLICDNPTRWRNTYKGFYELNLVGFPFTIVYIIERKQQQIVIISVHHHRRHPKKKYRK
jgi:plasmid stabilization system protein ParE